MFIFKPPVLINCGRLTVVFLHRCLMCAVPLRGPERFSVNSLSAHKLTQLTFGPNAQKPNKQKPNLSSSSTSNVTIWRSNSNEVKSFVTFMLGSSRPPWDTHLP